MLSDLLRLAIDASYPSVRFHSAEVSSKLSLIVDAVLTVEQREDNQIHFVQEQGPPSFDVSTRTNGTMVGRSDPRVADLRDSRSMPKFARLRYVFGHSYGWFYFAGDDPVEDWTSVSETNASSASVDQFVNESIPFLKQELTICREGLKIELSKCYSQLEKFLGHVYTQQEGSMSRCFAAHGA